MNYAKKLAKSCVREPYSIVNVGINCEKSGWGACSGLRYFLDYHIVITHSVKRVSH